VIHGFANADAFAGIAGAMSALPPQADIINTAGHVRKVPEADLRYIGSALSSLNIGA
jgi:hypothetical protein